MKKIILAFLVFLPIIIMAQNEGVIQYEETVSLSIDLPEDMKEMAAHIPSSQKSKMNLTFNAETSIYEDDKGNETSQDVKMESEDGGMQIHMKFEMPETKVFTDLANGKIIQKQEFMGKKFLITSEIEKMKWKLTGESEEILGYTCMEAVFQDSTENLEAWFTSEIPVSSGPQSTTGLPGMVLKLLTNEGQTSIVATNIELKKVDAKSIKAPKKGKKVTRAEFEKIREEKLKEMQEEYGGKGNQVIIRQ